MLRGSAGTRHCSLSAQITRSASGLTSAKARDAAGSPAVSKEDPGRYQGDLTTTHGSIAVTERVIRTLKYEWLRRVPLIRGLDHLELLLADFALYYNTWRPHSTLQGAVPDLIHAGRQWARPARTAEAVPANIERRFFPETRITGFRLAA